MKYLKRFNESVQILNEDFIQHVRDCFIEFSDKDDLYLDIDDKGFISLVFYLGEELKSPNVSELKSFYEDRLSVIKEIEVGFKRVKDDYPDFYYTSYNIKNSSLIFNVYPEVKIGDFFRKSGDLIILDYDKVKEILKLDKDVLVSKPDNVDYLLIDFKNQDHFIKNMYRGNFPDTDDMLVSDFNHHNLDMMRLSSDFDKLIIEGEKLITRIESIMVGESESVKYYGGRSIGVLNANKQKWSITLMINKEIRVN